MKRLLAFILLALCLIAAPASAQETLNVGIDPALAPFGYMEDGAVAGIDAEVAEAIAAQLGCDIEISVLSREELIAGLESGEIDIALGGLTEEEAPEGMFVTESYASNTQIVIVHEESGIESIADALGGRYTVAVREGSAADMLLTAVLGGESLERYDNGADAAADVVDGDVDCLMIDASPGNKYVARNSNIASLGEKYVDLDYCIYVADEGLYNEVNDALEAVKKDKTLRAIVNANIPTDEPSWINSLKADFRLNFIENGRWHFLTDGVVNTLQITFVALCIGILLGVMVAIVRTTHDKTIETKRPGLGKALLKTANAVCNVYLTVIRGTPAVVQLMIMYYIVFASSRNGVMIAMISFGINSGAYVAEIIRGGIMSIDNGQTEAGRSLGFSYARTMLYIVIPQAIKNVLPALANEFIVLLKETSVAGYVAVEELTKGGDIIRGTTYSAFMPLIAVALIYLAMVMLFTKLVAILERRLRNSDH